MRFNLTRVILTGLVWIPAVWFVPSGTAASIPPLAERVGFLDWKASVGDKLLVDTQENMGYLIHPNGEYFRFPVVTGQRRFVCYIGRCYNAATPNWTWEALSKEIKGDRVTFGPTGRFIRLFKDGSENTAYGIHEYKYEDKIFSENNRFGSMGCIIVQKPIMDLMERTFDLNEGALPVVTQYGINSALFALQEGI